MNPQRKNVAKLMARLNSKVAQFTVGSGGTSGAGDTPQMIAAALGSVASKSAGHSLAVAVLCVKWWPAAAAKFQLRTKPRHDPNCFWCENFKSGIETQRFNPCANGHATKTIEVVRTPHPQRRPWEPVRTMSGVSLIARYKTSCVTITIGTAMQHKVEDTLRNWIRRKAPRWSTQVPQDVINRINERPGFWKSFQDAVLSEYCSPQRCIGCGGAGQKLQMIKEQTKVTSKIIVCPICDGNGTVPKSNNRRAKAIGIRADDFARYLKPLYDQLLNLLRHLEYLAARAVSRSLRD